MSRSFGLPALVVVLLCAAGGAIWYFGAGVGIPLDVNSTEAKGADTTRPDTVEPKAPISTAIFVEPSLLEDGGLGVAAPFTRPVRDPHSLEELAASIQGRGRLGLDVLRAELNAIPQGGGASKDQLARAGGLLRKVGLLQMYEGQFQNANESFSQSLSLGARAGIPDRARLEQIAIQGIVALRLGEVSNCIACMGPSSCIFPIAPEAVHQQQAGSREAIEHFTKYLAEVPGDLRVRWLLNLAYMTLGEYPDKVPEVYRIPLDTFEIKRDVGRFQNVAPKVGLTSRGPNLAGGSVFDDFTGDGLPDLFMTSLDADRGASFFVNKGDGTFEDRSSKAGLDSQVYALNVVRADMDNDGDLDVALLRGGWEAPIRLSLLKNKGDATFEDVTLAAGLDQPIATEAACWGDFDNDGFADLFVCGEFLSPSGSSSEKPDPRNRCRLYRNKGDGTFEDVAARAGVANEGCSKGCAWGDYDGDGLLDLFVSNMTTPCRLYRNKGDGTFEDRAASLGVTGAERSFACWFWDYDNDGLLDLFVNDYSISLAATAAQALKIPSDPATRPRLYKNVGASGFRDVTSEVGLDRASSPMGCNFGDFDNDGYLDMYLGTGGMSYEYLVPNLLLKNVDGKRFEDVTMSSGTGHLQKGHGISFADFDSDGHLDLFCEAGGAVPGDNAFNLLFRNPGRDASWLRVKLVGTKSNRAALGARIRAVVKARDGTSRTIYRTVGNNSSFGGNSLAEHLGLGDAAEVEELEVMWPQSKTTQRLHQVAGRQTIVIKELEDGFTVQAPPKSLSISEPWHPSP